MIHQLFVKMKNLSYSLELHNTILIKKITLMEISKNLNLVLILNESL